MQRANRKGLICLLSPLRASHWEAFNRECGNRDAIGQAAPEAAWQVEGVREATEDGARPETVREGAKAGGSEEKGHAKEMPLRLC